VTLKRDHRLYGLGAIIFAALVGCARIPGGFGAPPYVITLAVAGVAYLLAIRELVRAPNYARHVILVCLTMAALWRIPFLLMRPGPQNDLSRYVWDGRVQRLGYNPYTAIPADPALAALHTDETREMNNPDVPSPYPPGAQFFFRAVTAIHESAFAFKVAFTACDLAIVLLLLAELRRFGQAQHWVLAYAWNPLAVTGVAQSPHIDILGVLLLLLSAAALGRRCRTTAAITFGLAIAVKFLPIVLVPLYWRRLRIRDGLLAALAVGMLYVPFLERGRIPIGSLGIYVQRFRFNDPVFATLERATGPLVAAGLAVLLGLATSTWLRSKHPECSSEEWAWPMAASLACAPVVYPWYLLWLVPFLRSVPTLPLIVWSVSILSTYFVWYLHALGHPWQVPGWIMLLEYGPVAAATAFILLRRPARAAMPITEGD
jgi:alpha-1,6-mannosyltransferase